MLSAVSLRTRFPLLVNMGLLLSYSLLIVLGLKHFTLWKTMRIFMSVCPIPSPLYIFHLRDPQALRYMMLWPFARASVAFGSDMMTQFPWLVLALLYLTSWVQAKTLPYLRPPASTADARWDTTRFLVPWLVIALFMHGRLAFTFLGASIILYAQTEFLAQQHTRYKLIGLHLLGLLLCSVSTGTFSVAFFVMMAFMFSLPLTHRSKTKIATDRTIMLVGAALVFLASPFVAQYIDKNLLYFDSFDNMLLRGDGAAHILYNAGVPATVLRALCYGYLLSVCIATIVGYLRAIRRRPVFAPIILLVGIAAMIGIFGYSTLLTMLPGLMLVAVLYAPALKNFTGR